ncbi:N-ethylmaleimide reductase [Longispora fulva]|uniref:N-ethylmaleimide reductase n=1 Tax=Longispora fulva TaxID=619741 RepID=A0A8J7GFC9_9ACTN|nr:N-ethylmaleimide reductase [Longispora fulva]
MELPNRLVMSPMTRNRAGDGGVPTALNAEYYAQRASAGLIITEGNQPSVVSQGYLATPGLHSAEQVAGWKVVTDAVHAEGGRIFAQIMHSGRIGHPEISGHNPKAPSPVQADGTTYTPEGPKDHPVPDELTVEEIAGTVADFATAARNAIAAGFDGVELHGANGYLLQQFLSDNANLRTDSYGGSVDNRIRFVVEVVQAVVDAVGAERTGLRLSPGNTYNGLVESDPAGVYVPLVRALEPLGLAYLHLNVAATEPALVDELRAIWSGPLLVNQAATGALADLESAEAWLERGADAVVYGRAFLANPDLVERLRTGTELNDADGATFYGGTHVGYTDYPKAA